MVVVVLLVLVAGVLMTGVVVVLSADGFDQHAARAQTNGVKAVVATHVAARGRSAGDSCTGGSFLTWSDISSIGRELAIRSTPDPHVGSGLATWDHWRCAA